MENVIVFILFLIVINLIVFTAVNKRNYDLLVDTYRQQCDISVDLTGLVNDLSVYDDNLENVYDTLHEDILALMHSYDCFTQDAIKILSSASDPGAASDLSATVHHPDFVPDLASDPDCYDGIDFTQEAYQISVADKGSDPD